MRGSGTTPSCPGPRPVSTAGSPPLTPAPGRRAASGAAVLDQVRARLDDDLDTPGAVAAIDAAVDRGEPIAQAAELLGVFLTA